MKTVGSAAPPRRRVLRQVLLALSAMLVFVGKKVFDYAAAPDGEKQSDFVFPPRAVPAAPRAPNQPPAGLRIRQWGGFTNDASHLNKTPVAGIVKVSSEDDVRKALAFARENGLKVTSLGQQHSMGGQTFTPGGLLLDMREMSGITVDAERKVAAVQAGVRWRELQQALDARALAVKAMQSINIFSVGGTLSVNAHGIDPMPGPVAPTVRSLRVMLSSGEILRASPTENVELLRHVLGGYGLFGVILDAELDVVANEAYNRQALYMDYREFPAWYRTNVERNASIGLVFGRLSVSPSSYLRETAAHVYTRAPIGDSLPALTSDRHETTERFVINLSKIGGLGRWTRWTLERYVEPQLHSCVSRNRAMSEDACTVSRNAEMYDDMDYLRNRLRDTDVLQEYFVPFDRMPAFVDGLRETVQKNGANLLNVTIRTVHKDSLTALPYAKDDMFGFVLYFNVGFNDADNRILEKTTTDLIDVSRGCGGTFYLPYQLFYSPVQLRSAYPEVDDFFATKKKYDPIGLFSNTWYEKYGGPT